jgi:hypothetical protein
LQELGGEGIKLIVRPNGGKGKPRTLLNQVKDAEAIFATNPEIIFLYLTELISFINRVEKNAVLFDDKEVIEFVRIVKRKIRMQFKDYAMEFPLTASLVPIATP